MGAVESCCFGSSIDEVETPDPEERRKQMLAAAEERKRREESRGLKDPERFKEQQKKKLEAEKMAPQGNSDGMRWQVG